MTAWAFEPAYRFYLYQTPIPNKTRTDWSRPRAFRLPSLMQIQASLVVSGQVGQMTATFADTDGALRRIVNPQPMNQVQLWLKSRCPGVGPQPQGPQFAGGWRPAWTGYVDTVEHTVDAGQGSMLTLTCSTPQKLWETTLQEEGNAFLQGATATMANVSGSMMLEYTALQVGYRTQMLRIDPYADSGSGYSANALMQASWNPELQSWGAVVQGFLASAGLEFFFDEEGHGIWRRVAFIGQRPLARQMLSDEILSATLATSDQGVYTDIEVRPAYGGATGAAAETGLTTALQNINQPGSNGAIGFWPARSVSDPSLQETEVMRQHLGRRFFVAYAPWVTSNASGAADQLAKVLGYQAAAGALHGQVSLIADPQFRVGSIVLVPPLKQDPSPWIIDQRPLSDDLGTFYYVQSVTYNLTWGSSWTMTLGLAYGHSRHNDFPYLSLKDSKGQVNYPVLSLAETKNLALEDRGFLSEETLQYFSFTVLPATPGADQPVGAPRISGLRDNEVACDPNLFKDGAEVRLTTPEGDEIPGGRSHNGYYTLRTSSYVSASDLLRGAGLKLYMNVPETVFGVKVVSVHGDVLVKEQYNDAGAAGQGAGGDPTNYRMGYDQPGNQTGVFSTTGATYTPNLQITGLVPPTAPGPPGLALTQAYSRAGQLYKFSHAGPDGWDCSGLVAWAYQQIGVTDLISGTGGSYSTDIGPDGIYSYFQDRGAQEINPANARPGDLLFIWLTPEQSTGEYKYAANQHGYAHIAFSIGLNHNFGANGPRDNTNTIGEAGNDGYNPPFNKALDMQSVHWDQVPGAPQTSNQTTGNEGGAANTDAQAVSAGTVAASAYNTALTFADPPGVSHYTQFGLQGQAPQAGGMIDTPDRSGPVLQPGQIGADGKRQFDCAGLVAWCYYQAGYKWDGSVTEHPDGSINYIMNAGAIYDHLSRRSDVGQIGPDAAQPADLLFCQEGSSMGHIGFCSRAGGAAGGGMQFAANDYSIGIRNQNMAGYSPPFTHALDMSQFTGK